jgi:hypothetical protein
LPVLQSQNTLDRWQCCLISSICTRARLCHREWMLIADAAPRYVHGCSNSLIVA